MKRFQFRQHGPEAADQVRNISNRVRKGYLVHAPPFLSQFADALRLELAYRPHQASPRPVRRHDEAVAGITPVRIVEVCNRSVTPTIGPSLLDQRKPVIERSTGRPERKAGSVGSADSAAGSSRSSKPSGAFGSVISSSVWRSEGVGSIARLAVAKLTSCGCTSSMPPPPVRPAGRTIECRRRRSSFAPRASR